MNSNIFRLCFIISFFRYKSHSLSSSAVVHAFLFVRYIMENDLLFSKQASVADFLIINGLDFSDPFMFAHTNKVSHSLFLPPCYLSDLKLKVRLSTNPNGLVSSALKTSFGSEEEIISSPLIFLSIRCKHLLQLIHFHHKFCGIWSNFFFKTCPAIHHLLIHPCMLNGYLIVII